MAIEIQIATVIAVSLASEAFKLAQATISVRFKAVAKLGVSPQNS